MAAVPSFSSFSLALHSVLKLCVLLFIIGPLSSYALDLSSTCPHVLTTSSIKNHRPSSTNSSLLVVVPWKVGFENFVKFNPDSCLIDGFSVQVFLQALRHMPPQSHLDFQFVLHGDGKETPSYEEMIDMVAKGEVDAVVADLTVTKDRMEKVGFTMPYLASSLVMVTPFRYGSAGTQWDFLRPFSWPLWLTLLASFVATGFALYLLENKNPDFSTTFPKEDHVVTSTDPSGHGSSSLAHLTPLPIASTHPIEASKNSLPKQVDNIPPLDPSSFQRLGPPIYDQASHKNRIMNAY